MDKSLTPILTAEMVMVTLDEYKNLASMVNRFPRVIPTLTDVAAAS